MNTCALGGTRTPNLLIRSQMLYPLSYERRHCSIPRPAPWLCSVQAAPSAYNRISVERDVAADVEGVDRVAECPLEEADCVSHLQSGGSARPGCRLTCSP